MEGKRQKQEVEIWQHEASMLFLLVLRCRVEGNYVQELKRLLEGKDSHLPIPVPHPQPRPAPAASQQKTKASVVQWLGSEFCQHLNEQGNIFSLRAHEGNSALPKL